jgi:DNA-binding NtrC family response regulator
MNLKTRVLVVDDEESIRKLLKSRLERDGYDVIAASNADEAEKHFSSGVSIGVLVTDVKMPGRDGFELTQAVQKKSRATKVVVITGHGEKTMAVRALREGATNYLEKPFDMDELSHAVKQAAHAFSLEQDNADLVTRLEARLERVEGKSEDQTWYVSKSSAMAKVNDWLNVLRRESFRGDAEEPTVLITGESGTGKEGIARMVHAGSRRAKGPWVAVNCANFNEQLLESELFGHERGAFTGATATKRGLFEIAKGGTLFLDEIGEMDVKLQAKLLRVLQEKAFRRVGGTADLQSDVRVVAATNRDLQNRVKGGQFREDLYHRLCRVVMELPALRERTEDVVPMATQFAERAFQARGKVFQGFSSDAETSLRNYPFPGNVRELLNLIERTSLVWTGSGKVSPEALSLPNASKVVSLTPNLKAVSAVSTDHAAQPPLEGGYMAMKKQWCDTFEREYLLASLKRHQGNVSAAAREAKLDRSNFLRLLRRHQIKAQAHRTGEAAAAAIATQKQAA